MGALTESDFKVQIRLKKTTPQTLKALYVRQQITSQENIEKFQNYEQRPKHSREQNNLGDDGV